ncbi:peptidase inhibitor family I36 protein [Streptomyces sp. NBC_01433]|uniref:peptidase inhibitor family I36 protein n=1 Tax=Streptomyces sp. NBC_01433 TaxID=2903864 RepID=UPI00225A8246|nr:peptidase inhibitor family I36 protein [Streptomyces sp. NBC_01433]MCX4679820.1 peptidase inhibitor family I36 protein [Streptomyces sp. NBC_01433]
MASAAVLVVGLATSAQAATGALTWTGQQGSGWQWTNPPSGVCETFNNTVTTSVGNHTNQRVTLYPSFNCTGASLSSCAGCTTDVSTQFYSFKF